ncbi:hypothetical protein BDN72DRAFT_779087, partial [Pluteus cervinus]
PLAVVRLSQTNHRIHKVVTEYLPHRYSASRVLSRFLTTSEYDSLRPMQCQSGLLVVGSAALNVFDPTTQIARGLDLMVHTNFKEEVEDWLKSIGYNTLPSDPMDTDRPFPPREDDESPLREIRHFMRGDSLERSKHIYLFLTRNTPIEVVLTSDLKTRLRLTPPSIACNMHFLTANNAISLYPYSTFGEREALKISNDPGLRSSDFIRKYEHRGWTVTFASTATQRNNPKSDFFVPGQRHIGDEKSWITRCNTGEPLSELHPLHFTTSWELQYDPVYFETVTDFHLIEERPFKFTYVMAEDPNIDRVVNDVLRSENSLEDRDQLLKQALETHFG